jgi:hypothetical protein
VWSAAFYLWALLVVFPLCEWQGLSWSCHGHEATYTSFVSVCGTDFQTTNVPFNSLPPYLPPSLRQKIVLTTPQLQPCSQKGVVACNLW